MPGRGLPGLRPVALVAAAPALYGLSLSGRSRLLRDALLADLPADHRRFEAVIDVALDQSAFTGWMIWPVSEAVAVRALDGPGRPGFDTGLALLARLTPRLTGEFALRSFLDADLDRTLAAVQGWTTHPDEHVRRLASEGTRPRLPWARRVSALTARPDATVPVLDALHRDPSEYVRRSVANHLNDLSRADAALVVAIATRWLGQADGHTVRLVRHALRTLIKAGDPEALALLGFGASPDVTLAGPLRHDSSVVRAGELVFEVAVVNAGTVPATVAIDYVIHHRKANGSQTPKVFKLTTRTLGPGETATIVKRHSFRPITTRTYHPGEHAIEIQINGTRHGRSPFQLG